MSTMVKLLGILSYPHVFQPRAVQQGQDAKYSVGLLIPKGDPQIAVLQAAIEAEKVTGFPNGFPNKATLCLKDAAIEWPDNPQIAGYMFVSAGTGIDSKPVVVDASMQPVMDPSLVYAGAEAWISINVCSYDKPMNKGITAYLQGLMVTGNEGATGRIDGRPTAEQMFAGVGGAPAPAPAAAAHQMTASAGGATYESMIAAGWTDQTLIQAGHMLPPGGVAPVFM